MQIALADALERQSLTFGAGPATLANIAQAPHRSPSRRHRPAGRPARRPAATLLKAATAIARAKQATAATGIEHVPIFWLATEDHDLEEVDQVSLLTKTSVETLRLGVKAYESGSPVGELPLGSSIDALSIRLANSSATPQSATCCASVTAARSRYLRLAPLRG